MTSRLVALCFEANDPLRLGRFWADVLRWDLDAEGGNEIEAVPTDATTFALRFVEVAGPKSGKNPIHLDLMTTSIDDQTGLVAQAVELGARSIDVGQRPEEGHVVLADPEGNEFCVIEPDNSFLAGCERLGSITCDGSPAVGSFWRDALGWPLVWDQDEETAIRGSDGAGPFITWGPPVPRSDEPCRLHLEIAPDGDTDPAAEVDRLVGLGANRVEAQAERVVMSDPDGIEFWISTPR